MFGGGLMLAGTSALNLEAVQFADNDCREGNQVSCASALLSLLLFGSSGVSASDDRATSSGLPQLVQSTSPPFA